MAALLYHASHEQFSPSQLLQFVQLAEKAGFDGIHSSDHFHPWSVRQGQSGFSFSWLGAAMQATTLPFSVIVAPGQRYHPAIVAQAIATLAEMFPNRFNVELGSGEALNEMITGEPWPEKEKRNERLLECVMIIRRLLNGEEVTHRGLVQVREARLFTLPREKPKIYGASITEETTEWVGTWADGLLTTADEEVKMRKKVELFRKHAGNKPVTVQFGFSYGKTEEEAIAGAHHQWRSNIVSTDKLAEYYKPEHFDNAGRNISKEEVAKSIPSITDMNELMARLNVFEEIGIEKISLHNINRNHEQFIEDFGNWKIKNGEALMGTVFLESL